MVLGRVIGTAVATRKYPGLEGAKLLVVQELTKALQPRGRPAVAVDVAHAGVGDIVVMARKREAAIAYYPSPNMPLDLAVVGVVDTVDLAGPYDMELPFGYTRFE
ncbi:MAG: EutN/CcmL family microcompartment protein [Caldilineales bacterium]|nr:EutN/CcmL family microcompartment protein [Caldilineales bacterium]